jgi:glycosyltransferase involved in cell wall biosynthesis
MRVLPRAPGERERLVVSVGRVWDEAKNAALLAQAAPAIDGRVAVIGPGSLDGVECLGTLGESQVLDWLARAAVFAEPARYEPFGLAALEAALSGCALVLGDIPSLREVWGQAATFVSPDDPAALASEINALFDDARLRRRRAADAFTLAQTYTPAAMADAYLSAYEDVVRVAVAA